MASQMFGMTDRKKERRHWRVIAQELATETDPAKMRLLLEELTKAVRFVRYEDRGDSSSGEQA